VASVTLVKQADGRSKGYAFVDMVEKEAGEKAIADLNGSDIDGRNLNVALGGDSK
jgi:RNA recognition motif-containing protein